MTRTIMKKGASDKDRDVYPQMLSILSDVLEGERVADKIRLSILGEFTEDSAYGVLKNGDMLKKLFVESVRHNIFPLIMDGLFTDDPSENHQDQKAFLSRRMQSLYRNEILRQAQKTADFLVLYEYLSSKGLHPVVLKGLICRSLYPKPEHRSSVDEDLLIDPEEFEQYHRALTECGFTVLDPVENIWDAFEVSYEDAEKHLYIELHKKPFPENSKAYTKLNTCFEGALQRSVELSVYETPVRTLDFTDQLLYLILHTYKHFIYSGFGIRQVADIMLFTKKHRAEICWNRVRAELEKVGVREYSGAVFKICERYLSKEEYLSDYLKDWDYMRIDEKPLLDDILTGGIFGANDMNRVHSAYATLETASVNYRFRSVQKLNIVFRSLFPGKDYLKKKYPYAHNHPGLLPFAWGQRIVEYLRRSETEQTNPMESIRIGQERCELLRKYGITTSLTTK